MLILLPPSERKEAPRRRGRPARFEKLSFPQLHSTREIVREVLAEVSASPQAYTRFGLSAAHSAEVDLNTRQHALNAIPVEELYTGTLYDVLDPLGLTPHGRRRARTWVVVLSALHGALRLRDRVPPYRLSIGTRLPGLPPLASVWRPALERVLPVAVGGGMVLDARSGGYAAMWTPPPVVAPVWVHIQVPGASHMAKKTRGEVVRAVCSTVAPPPEKATEVLEIVQGALSRTHHIELHPASSRTRPWVLSVVPRNLR